MMSKTNFDDIELETPGIEAGEINSEAATDGQVLTADGAGAAAFEALPVASVTVSGIVELATTAEAQAGTDTARAVTPSGLPVVIGAADQVSSSNATATGIQAVGLGKGAAASSAYAVGIGFNSVANGSAAVAIGNATQAGEYAVGLGSNVVATGVSSIAIGNGATSSGYKSGALGHMASAFGPYSLALGYSTIVNAAANFAIAIGSYAGASAAGVSGIAIGRNAQSQAASAVAIGPSVANATANSVKIGWNNTTGFAHFTTFTPTVGVKTGTHFLPVNLGGTVFNVLVSNV